MIVGIFWYSLYAKKVMVTLFRALMSAKPAHMLSLFTQAEYVHIRCLVPPLASNPCRYYATRCSVPLTMRCTWKVCSM